MQAGVKVMRSYDYCHFEVSLSSDEDMTIEQVDEMRKKAALLVDEAVRQYKIAKEKEQKRDRREYDMRRSIEQVERIKKIPKEELSIGDAALLKSYEEGQFWKSYNEDQYFYDDPERELHFSMLYAMKGIKIKTSEDPSDLG